MQPKEIILSGFDDHIHIMLSVLLLADPFGSDLYGRKGFLHTNVETAYGTVRGTNGGS